MCGIGPDATPCGDDNPYDPDQWEHDDLWDTDEDTTLRDDDDLIGWAVCHDQHRPHWPSTWIARHHTRHA